MKINYFLFELKIIMNYPEEKKFINNNIYLFLIIIKNEN